MKSVYVIDPSKKDTLPSLFKEGRMIIEKTLPKKGWAR
jgi:hypothetical protein